MAIRQSMGASRRHVVRQVMTETVLLTAVGGLLGVVGGRVGNSIAPGSWRESFAARRAYRVRWLARVDRPRRRGGSRSRHRGADRLVQPEQSSRRTRSNRNRAPARSAAPRNGCATASSSRRSRSPLFCSPARRLLGLSLKKVMAVSPGFRPDHVLTGECTISWQLQRDASRHRRSLARIDPPATGNRRRRNDHEHSAERRQRQNRGHTEGLCATAGSISPRSLFLWR